MPFDIAPRATLRQRERQSVFINVSCNEDAAGEML
jgi:hypothetical protein